MIDQIYQIQIYLKYIKPKIWRRILVKSDLSLLDFHKIIQTCTGWTNFHLHQFIKDNIRYTIKTPYNVLNEYDNINEKNVKIHDLLKIEKEKIIYEYDFGDSWIHIIILEKILPIYKNMEYPICIKGKRSFPPEDCGSYCGYENMLEILKNSKHKEYKSYIEWLGGKFDSEYFNKDEINNLLKKENYGCTGTFL